MGSDGEALGQSARSILEATDVIGRWWAQDFKPGKTPDDLTWTQFAILSLAEGHPGINLSQVAERLGVSAPTVGRAVDALERKELVVRKRVPGQQPHVIIQVTPEGSETRRAVEEMRFHRLLQLLRELTVEELTGLVLGFQGMVRVTTQDAVKE